MQLDKLLVAIFGGVGIFFTYWFFLMKKDEVVAVKDQPEKKQGFVEIIVDGGYSPSTILLQKGKTTRISFFRKDPSTCLEEVVLPDFKIRKFLPMKTPITISVTPEKAGEYEIVCGMNMFHGKIIVQ